jgi:hypothetical protein
MPMLGQLFEQPQPPDLTRFRVMQDVDLPYPEPYLAVCRGEHYAIHIRLS